MKQKITTGCYWVLCWTCLDRSESKSHCRGLAVQVVQDPLMVTFFVVILSLIDIRRTLGQ